nr:FAD-dependent monooxygenase [Nitrospirota bacterium]
IMKGSSEENRKRGLDAFREDVARLAPFSADRREKIRTWDDVKLLTVQVDRLLHWYKPGLLCIGDAAHAMSPIGGVGVNLAVQDGVAAANLLAKPLREGRLTTDHLRLVQQRRLLPTRIVQGMQVLVQKQVVSKVLSGTGPMKPPLPLKLFARFPFLRRLPARLIGVGVRPEHVRTESAGWSSMGN